MKKSQGLRIAQAILFMEIIFIYLPLAVLVINSFNLSRSSAVWSGFSLKWYKKLFRDRAILTSLLNTLLVTGVSVLASTLLGTLAGAALGQYRSRFQKSHKILVAFPLMMPDILMGISLLLFFLALKVPLGLGTIIIGHITFCISYVASTVQSRFQNFDHCIVEAARDLGAGTFYLIFRIYLPLLLPGILSGAMLALTLSLDDFIITFFTAGPGASTLPVHIYSMIRHGSPPVINALSSLFIGATFIILLVYRRIPRRFF